MIDFKSLSEFLSKLSINELGKHFNNISELYTNPIKSWKRIISYRKESYDLFLLFVVYYSIIVSFIISNTKYIIPITILELVLTIIPFSFLYPPFLFFRKKWNKKIKSNRLFRLLFVLKIQFNILPFGLIILAKWTGIESLYIIIENLLWLILLIFISAFPLLLNLKIIQKTLWICTNYVFSLIFFLLLVLFSEKNSDFELLGEKIATQTPNTENLKFNNEYNFSDIEIDSKYYIALFDVNNKKVVFRNTQFGTINLVYDIMQLNSRNLKNKVRILDSLKRLPDNNIEIDSFSFHNEKINKIFLDSLRLKFDKLFYADLILTDSLKANALFNSNKKFYKLINSHLTYYDSIYTSEKAIKKIINTKPEFIVETDENGYAVIFEYKDPIILKRKVEINKMRTEFERRENYSTFFQKIYTYPIVLFINITLLNN